MAAAAIKLAPRGEKGKYAEEAARRLRVKRNHIKEFQQNLSRGRIKSQMANDIYDWCLFLGKQNTNTTQTETALWLLSQLKPVFTKRRDLE